MYKVDGKVLLLLWEKMTFMEQFSPNFLLDFTSRPPPHPFRVSWLITVDYLCCLVAFFIFYLYSTMDVDRTFQDLNYKWGRSLAQIAPRLLPSQRTPGGKQSICPQNNVIMGTVQMKRFEWYWNFHTSRLLQAAKEMLFENASNELLTFSFSLKIELSL